jgi:divalent metal cation (Fe/Co/Zn/Cd) transporter
MDRSVDSIEIERICATLAAVPGLRGYHDLRTRKMGDMIVVDVHLEIDATLSVEASHAIAVETRRRVLAEHRVLNVMTHVDPWRADA